MTDFKTLHHAAHAIAFRQDGVASGETGGKPGLLFLPGYASDMLGSKAEFLARQALAQGYCLTRFDYRGHGASSGNLRDGCIGDWLEDATAVLDSCTAGPQILIGSSMGGWLMLLLALRRPTRVAGLIGLAAAPDFTQTLIWDKLTPDQRLAFQQQGVFYEPSPYGAPLPFSWKLVREGRNHLLLANPIPLTCPIRLLHGMADADVPWQTAPQLAAQLSSADVKITLLKTATHRLSEPPQLALLWQEVVGLGTRA